MAVTDLTFGGIARILGRVSGQESRTKTTRLGEAEAREVMLVDRPAAVLYRLSDHQVVFLSDILPTGWMAVEQCGIQPDDIVAIWGCGPVGQFAIRSAAILGARRVIALDDGRKVPERLRMAREGGAVTVDTAEEEVFARLLELTDGVGADVCVDAVGMEAHGYGLAGAYDKVKSAAMLETERPYVVRQAIQCCRKGGTVSIPGVYGGVSDKFPLGALMNKGLTVKTGQTHVHRYVPTLLDHIRSGRIDPSFAVTHRLPLADAPRAYEMFRDKKDGCIKVVLDPVA